MIEEPGAVMLHEGERVVPAAQVSDRGPAPSGVSIGKIEVKANSRAAGREAGKALRDELNRFDIG